MVVVYRDKHPFHLATQLSLHQTMGVELDSRSRMIHLRGLFFKRAEDWKLCEEKKYACLMDCCVPSSWYMGLVFSEA